MGVYEAGLAGDMHDQLVALSAGTATSVGLVDHALAAITDGDAQLRAFAVVLADAARADAVRADAARAAGLELPLLGIPVAVKADLAVAGVRPYLQPDGEPAAADCPEVAALRAAGAVVLGHTSMSEAALWATTASRLHGATRNPHHARLSPGGSSGGSAAAVAAGWASGAVGTDMGGSVRIPAACCGLVGLKPQRGRRPADPADRRWHGLREPGPIARTVRDCALLHWVLGGPPPPQPGQVPAHRTRLRVGVLPSGERAAGGAVSTAAALLNSLGHDVFEVAPLSSAPVLAAGPRYLRAAADEVGMLGPAAVLERRTTQAAHLGRLVPRFVTALSVRTAGLLESRVRRLFKDVDVLLTPALGGPVPPLAAWSTSSAIHAGLAQRRLAGHTALWNVTGHPALVMPLPAATARAASRPPPSIQLVGRPWTESTLLSLAAALEELAEARSPVAASAPTRLPQEQP